MTSWAVKGAGEGKTKPGSCPSIYPSICLIYEPPECQNDWQCPKRQKCCRGICNMKCLDPVNPSRSGKINPNMCPLAFGQCMIINAPWHCQVDSQ
uniref:WAP domain-containing protein n=1 Tax=Sus scrofa TaxID=9823 RepID=A0A8D1DPP6_PIG